MPGVRCGLLALLLPCLAQAATMRLCVDNNARLPYLTPDGGGIAGTLIRQAAADTGIQVEFVSLPMQRCREGVRANVQDGYPTTPYAPDLLPGAAYPLNKGVVDPSRAVMVGRSVVFRRKGSAADWDGKQFHNVNTPILVRFGALYLVQRIKDLHMVPDGSGKSIEGNFAKLLAGRADIMVGWEYDGRQAMERPEFKGKIEILARPFAEIPYYLALNNRYLTTNPGVAEQMWEAIGRIRQSPQFQAISRDLIEQAAKAPPD